ncbi:hypothetical protein B5X24_HaOG211195 [Helicoverpa armigera]|nr:hypothetical protein B5X24_HaOG211195 [Helicoverpa armigera]
MLLSVEIDLSLQCAERYLYGLCGLGIRDCLVGLVVGRAEIALQLGTTRNIQAHPGTTLTCVLFDTRGYRHNYFQNTSSFVSS